MSFERSVPYNRLPLLPPRHELETKEVLKLALSAARALAELKTKGHLLPNQSLLIDSLMLLEAKDSSEIENIFTTHDKLYQADALDGVKIDAHTKEVTKYREALWLGIDEIKKRPLCSNIFIEIVQTIKENQAGIRTTPGTRIVTPENKLIYTPPEGYDILITLLKNLEDYIHAKDRIEPLIKMAVLHYQFEAIHPFSDGNGRTGRILNILYLIQEGLLESPVLFLSNYIIRHKTEYYKGLQNVTEHQNWTGWVSYMLRAVEKTSYETIKRIEAIRNAMNEYQVKMEKELPNIYTKDLLEVLFQQPYCQIDSLVKNDIAKRATASNYLKQIEKIGLLKSSRIKNHIVYLNPTLLDILSKSSEAF